MNWLQTGLPLLPVKVRFLDLEIKLFYGEGKPPPYLFLRNRQTLPDTRKKSSLYFKSFRIDILSQSFISGRAAALTFSLESRGAASNL